MIIWTSKYSLGSTNIKKYIKKNIKRNFSVESLPPANLGEVGEQKRIGV